MTGSAANSTSSSPSSPSVVVLGGGLSGIAAALTLAGAGLQVTVVERGASLGGLAGSLIRGAFKNVPLQVNLNISGPFRALIQMAKGFKDPRQVIAPCPTT